MPIWVGVSENFVPIYFAILTKQEVVVPLRHGDSSLLNIFDELHISTTDDDIVNGPAWATLDGEQPLPPF